MEKRTLAVECTGTMNGQQVCLHGWVHRVRSFGSFAFLVLRDRSGTIQCVGEAPALEALPEESVVTVHGRVGADDRAPGGAEVHIDSLVVESEGAPELPMQVNIEREEPLERLLDYRVLALRRPSIQVVFRLQSALQQLFREYLLARDFVEVHSPKVVATGTEGGAELFRLEYFENEAFLAQSPQLYKELLVAGGFERVFEVGPVYRAEKHNTSRHVNEYVSLDVEVGFVYSADELMDLEEGLIRWLREQLPARLGRWAALVVDRLPGVPGDIPRLAFADALELVRGAGGVTTGDLNPTGEQLLSDYTKEEYGSDWVFVTHYPVGKRPFYTLTTEREEQLTESFDLVCRGLEVTTGGLRHHDHDRLVGSIRRRGYRPQDYRFYTDSFRYGMPPHGGFAIGLERLTMQLLGLHNIREATLFPRDRTRLTP